MSIPKLVHQTLPSKQKIHPAFAENIANLKRLNPTWEHRLYDDQDIPPFILRHYGQDVIDCFNTIDPRYGAARADFFRYLLMYVEGGVYLDIKSTAIRPLDEVLRQDDEYILSHWPNQSVQEFAGSGSWPGMGPKGEFQQWHIICAARHPFLESVIETIKTNIEGFCVGKICAGRFAVLNITGPVAYTKAIQPISQNHKHRQVDIRDLGFRYTVLPNYSHFDKLGPHYSGLEFPLLRLDNAMVTDKLISTLSGRFNGGISDLFKSAFMARSNGGSARIVTFHGTTLLYLFQLDRCIHEDEPRNCLHVPVQFELFGASLSFFVEVGGIKIRLGVNVNGSLTSQFEASEQGAPPLFQIGGQGDGHFTIAWKECFLSAEPSGRLIFNRTTAKRWESFSATHNPPTGAVRNSVQTLLSAE